MRKYSRNSESIKETEMKVAWFSCGCSSLVATKLAKPDKVIYIHVTNQHPDTLRFLDDARKILGDIEVLQSEEYASVDDVIERTKYINGAYGARCTLELKNEYGRSGKRSTGLGTRMFGALTLTNIGARRISSIQCQNLTTSFH